MSDDRRLGDLKGWRLLTSLRSPLGGSYAVYISPDEKKVAQVHLEDDEIVLILNRETKEIEYMHPVTKQGLKNLGVTPDEFITRAREEK